MLFLIKFLNLLPFDLPAGKFQHELCKNNSVKDIDPNDYLGDEVKDFYQMFNL